MVLLKKQNADEHVKLASSENCQQCFGCEWWFRGSIPERIIGYLMFDFATVLKCETYTQSLIPRYLISV